MGNKLLTLYENVDEIGNFTQFPYIKAYSGGSNIYLVKYSIVVTGNAMHTDLLEIVLSTTLTLTENIDIVCVCNCACVSVCVCGQALVENLSSN